jgi:lysophospholipase L1-like esterase
MAKALPARVKLVDLYPCLSGQAKDSTRLFLYADAMHFSKAGHKAVFDCLNSDPQLLSEVERSGS